MGEVCDVDRRVNVRAHGPSATSARNATKSTPTFTSSLRQGTARHANGLVATMPVDRLLSTLLRSLQTYTDQQDTPRYASRVRQTSRILTAAASSGPPLHCSRASAIRTTSVYLHRTCSARLPSGTARMACGPPFACSPSSMPPSPPSSTITATCGGGKRPLPNPDNFLSVGACPWTSGYVR